MTTHVSTPTRRLPSMPVACAVLLLSGLGLSALAAASEPEPSLYDRLGGEAAIRAVVDDFVATAAPDPKVDFTRDGTWNATPAAVARLKQLLVEFVGHACGGPIAYTGRDMRTTHAGMKITQAQFSALAGHLDAALRKNGVGAVDLAAVMKIAGSTAADIVEAP